MPLSRLLTKKNFPNRTIEFLRRIGEELDKASTEMFEQNMHRGCMDPKAFNYDYQVNTI